MTALAIGLRGRHFVSMKDVSADELMLLLDTASTLKAERARGAQKSQRALYEPNPVAQIAATKPAIPTTTESTTDTSAWEIWPETMDGSPCASFTIRSVSRSTLNIATRNNGTGRIATTTPAIEMYLDNVWPADCGRLTGLTGGAYTLCSVFKCRLTLS